MLSILYSKIENFTDYFTKSQYGKIKILFKNEINIRLMDILMYFPFKYVKYTESKEPSNAFIGSDLIIWARVEKHIKPRYFKGRKTMYSIHVETKDGNKILLIFFQHNKAYLEKFMEKKVIKIRGKLSMYKENYSISHPSLLGVYDDFIQDEISNSTNYEILPKYRLASKVSQSDIKSIMKICLKILQNSVSEVIPCIYKIKELHLNLAGCLNEIHFPVSENNLSNSIKAMAFEEFVASFFAINFARKNDKNNGIVFIDYQKDRQILLDNFGFNLTQDQENVLSNIVIKQVSRDKMFKLIQGDVGCGKTIVALLACINVIKSGYSCLFLAPTTILAMQHFLLAEKLFFNLCINSELLTSKVKLSKRRQILGDFKNGNVDILFGTHSLFNDEVNSDKIGLIIIDEQHRFGVNQRISLIEKNNEVDILMMSATPIPRSLAMGMYGDIDLEKITQKPSFQKPIITSIISMQKYNDLIIHILEKINEGEKVYWICHLIDDETNESGVFQRFEDIKKHIDISKIAILHGKMKEDEKNEIIQKFQNTEVSLLISTTVVEVGVNVVDATIIIIEDANKFGLAQLHQLRGRVGRGDMQSYCILLHNCEPSDIGIDKLQVIKKNLDGFEIAKEDMKTRGIGSVLGVEQSGDVGYKIANIQRDFDVMEYAIEFTKKTMKNQINDDEILINFINRIMQTFFPNDYAKYLRG